MFHIVFSRYNLILCRIFSRYLRHFTLILLQKTSQFTFVLLQTFAIILIYWHLYSQQKYIIVCILWKNSCNNIL